ncbi:hypothetical protein WN943_025521 [Citrus x changshan-huyou]
MGLLKLERKIAVIDFLPDIGSPLTVLTGPRHRSFMMKKARLRKDELNAIFNRLNVKEFAFYGLRAALKDVIDELLRKPLRAAFILRQLNETFRSWANVMVTSSAGMMGTREASNVCLEARLRKDELSAIFNRLNTKEFAFYGLRVTIS